MTCDLTNPIFTNEAAAVAHMEADRWPNGPVCPMCGADNVTKMADRRRPEFPVRRLPGQIHGQDGHRVRAVPYPPAQMASGDAFDGVVQERH